MIENRVTSSNSQYLDASKIEFANYPIEVSVTKAALERIIFECYENEHNSQMDIFAKMKCGACKPLCNLTCNFFGQMSTYSAVFEENGEDDLSPITQAVDAIYMRLLTCYRVLSETPLKPSVRYNSHRVPCLVFTADSFNIETEKPIKVSIYHQRSFSIMSKYEACQHVGEEFLSLNPIYILSTHTTAEQSPVEITFSVNAKPDLLHIEMDYKDGKWSLKAIQRSH